MKRKYFFNGFATFAVLILFVIIVCAHPKTTADDIRNKMQCFVDAKLGIFIHWGMYSVNSVDEGWSFYNKKISYTDYMKQLKGFTASK